MQRYMQGKPPSSVETLLFIDAQPHHLTMAPGPMCPGRFAELLYARPAPTCERSILEQFFQQRSGARRSLLPWRDVMNVTNDRNP